MRGFGLGRGAAAIAMAVLLAGCAVDRSALKPDAGPPTAARPASVRTAPRGPMTADQLARRMGLRYEDQSSHVLLADNATRVRIWKDSNEVSVAGRITRLPAKSRRQGQNLLLPAQTVSYVEHEVSEERKRWTPAAYEPKGLVTPYEPIHLPEPIAIVPVTPRPTPTPTLTPRPSPRRQALAADPAWSVHARSNREWRWIVIHHSDDTVGNLERYDRIHRESNGWDECGYHFVIGNGSLSADGEIEVGPRWVKQKHGAHAKDRFGGNQYNDHGIGICLVGDFENVGRPSAAQMDGLVRLTRWLMATYGIQAHDVIGHADCKPTCCPGRLFPWAEFRRRIQAP